MCLSAFVCYKKSSIFKFTTENICLGTQNTFFNYEYAKKNSLSCYTVFSRNAARYSTNWGISVCFHNNNLYTDKNL